MDLEGFRNQQVWFDIETDTPVEDLFTTQKISIIQMRVKNTDHFIRIDMQYDRFPEEWKTYFAEVYQTMSIGGHNLQFDIGQVYHFFNVLPKSVFEDTYVMARMLQEQKQGLKDLGKIYLGKPIPAFSFPVRADGTYNYDVPEFDEYSHYDVETPEKLAEYFRTTNGKYFEEMKFIYNVELALIPVVAKMQAEGLNFDIDKYPEVLEKVEQEIGESEAKLFEKAGTSFRVTSNADVAKILFEDMGLMPRILTPNGAPSTSQEALAFYEGNEIVDGITSLKSMKSVHSSFKNIPKSIVNGKVHPEFKVIGYDGTSRIYTDPSVNQWAKIARTLITPDEGNKFVYFDLSAAEMYVALYWAKEESAVEFYTNGGDIHRFIASRVFGKPMEAITKEDREASKVVEFSILFGSEGAAAARKLKIAEEDGRALVDQFFRMFPRVKENNNNMISFCDYSGYTKTILGRKRKLGNGYGRITKAQSRQAVNTAVQASVADLQKMIIIRLNMLGYKVKFTVFDSFLLEVPKDQDMGKLKEDLDRVVNFDRVLPGFKFNYSLGEGNTWYEAQENS